MLSEKAATKHCWYPGCVNTAINSHTVSKSYSLAKIAENQHVQMIEVRRGTTNFNSIGVNQATTFKGFCNKHDTEVFQSIDFDTANPFLGTPEQYSTLCLRGALMEAFRKAKQHNHHSNIDRMDEKVLTSEYHMPAHAANSYKEDSATIVDGSGRAIVDMDAVIGSLFHQHETEQYHLTISHTREIYGVPNVVTSCMFQIKYDIEGNEIGDDYLKHFLHLNIVPFADKSIVVIAFHRKSKDRYSAFVEQFMSLDEEILKTLVSKMLIIYTESACFRASMVNQLDQEERGRILKLFERTIYGIEKFHHVTDFSFF